MFLAQLCLWTEKYIPTKGQRLNKEICSNKYILNIRKLDEKKHKPPTSKVYTNNVLYYIYLSIYLALAGAFSITGAM